MNKNLKRLSSLAIAFLLTLSMSACKNDSKETSQTTTTTTQSTTEATTVSDVESYKKTVEDLSTEIENTSLSIMQGLDPNDYELVIKTTKDLITTISPLYEELGNLKAPTEYAEAQEKVKNGVTASLKLLELSNDMMELALNESEESQAKAEELMAGVLELQIQSLDLTEGLKLILSESESESQS